MGSCCCCCCAANRRCLRRGRRRRRKFTAVSLSSVWNDSFLMFRHQEKRRRRRIIPVIVGRALSQLDLGNLGGSVGSFRPKEVSLNGWGEKWPSRGCGGGISIPEDCSLCVGKLARRSGRGNVPSSLNDSSAGRTTAAALSKPLQEDLCLENARGPLAPLKGGTTTKQRQHRSGSRGGGGGCAILFPPVKSRLPPCAAEEGGEFPYLHEF